jgi:hypothetical protein
MKRLLILLFVLTVLAAAGVLVFHRPSREQSKHALKKITPTSLARVMTGVRHKTPKPPIHTNRRGAGKANPNVAFLVQSLRLLSDLLAAVGEDAGSAPARRKSVQGAKSGAHSEDVDFSFLSRLLNSAGIDPQQLLRRALETGLSNETLRASGDLLENLVPTPGAGKAKTKTRR